MRGDLYSDPSPVLSDPGLFLCLAEQPVSGCSKQGVSKTAGWPNKNKVRGPTKQEQTQKSHAGQMELRVFDVLWAHGLDVRVFRDLLSFYGGYFLCLLGSREALVSAFAKSGA